MKGYNAIQIYQKTFYKNLFANQKYGYLTKDISKKLHMDEM